MQALLLVFVDDRLSLLLERPETLPDGFNVVVRATGGLPALKQPDKCIGDLQWWLWVSEMYLWIAQGVGKIRI